MDQDNSISQSSLEPAIWNNHVSIPMYKPSDPATSVKAVTKQTTRRTGDTVHQGSVPCDLDDRHQQVEVHNTVNDLKLALRQSIAHATRGIEPEKLCQTFVLHADALLPIRFPPEQHRRSRNGDTPLSSTAWTVADLCKLAETKERRSWQRGAARGLLLVVQEVDGFKYTVNNNWSSKDDAGFRFSYTCLDSKENKDRQANCDRRMSNNPEDPDTSMQVESTSTSLIENNNTPAEPRGIRKVTYDCKGQVAVKFSGARNVVELVYRHTALHDSTKNQASSSAAKNHNRSLNKHRLVESDDCRASDATDAASLHDSVAAMPLHDSASLTGTPLPHAKRRKHSDAIFRVPTLSDLQRVPLTSHPDDNIPLAELLRSETNQEPPRAYTPHIPAAQSTQQNTHGRTSVEQRQHQPTPPHSSLPPLSAMPTAPLRTPSAQHYPQAMNCSHITGAPNNTAYPPASLSMYIPPQYSAADHRFSNSLVYQSDAQNGYSQSQSSRPDLGHQVQTRHGVNHNHSVNLVNPVNWYQQPR